MIVFIHNTFFVQFENNSYTISSFSAKYTAVKKSQILQFGAFWMSVNICQCVCLYLYTQIHTHTHTHIYIYIYIYVHKLIHADHLLPYIYRLFTKPKLKELHLFCISDNSSEWLNFLGFIVCRSSLCWRDLSNHSLLRTPVHVPVTPAKLLPLSQCVLNKG